MKFLPAIQIWNPAINDAVRNGQLKLLPGQWIKCGPDLSRFVGVSRAKVIWAVHKQKGRIQITRFKQMISNFRKFI